MKIGRPRETPEGLLSGFPAPRVRWVIRDQPVEGEVDIVERVLVLQYLTTDAYFTSERRWFDVPLIREGEL